MKLIYIFLISVFIFVINSSSSVEPRNPELEVTGAPGEQTCQKSNCHSGGSFVGTVRIEGVPDSVVPGTNYPIKLIHKSNAVITGFELTVLDQLNKKCGSLISGFGSNTANSGNLGRQYIRHSNAKQLVDSIAEWDFSWTSPTSLAGDTITFYFASLCGSNTMDEKGDNAIVNKKKIRFLRPSVVSDETFNDLFISPNPVQDNLFVHSKSIDPAGITIYDMNGRMVLYRFGSLNQVINVNDLARGIYNVVVQTGTKNTIRKIFLE